jgi:hypothetical protein
MLLYVKQTLCAGFPSYSTKAMVAQSDYALRGDNPIFGGGSYRWPARWWHPYHNSIRKILIPMTLRDSFLLNNGLDNGYQSAWICCDSIFLCNILYFDGLYGGSIRAS